MPENANTNSRPRVLSGMRPTGKLHLGNYMGALANWVKLQDQFECYFFIADWHALTTDYADTTRLKLNTLEVALDWLAAGLDPNKSTLFIQSHVPQHAELHLLFSMITPLGWLERVPTYKEQQENLTGKDLSTYGFLGYPLLQAADILIYRADRVPVGQDQVAHVELTREVARRFNQYYPQANLVDYQGARHVERIRREILPEPQALLTPSPKLPGTDGRKMSKSYGNTIGLTEDPSTVRHKLSMMTTNGQRPTQNIPGDPDLCPVGDMHKLFSNPVARLFIDAGCRTAKIGCKDCKVLAAESISQHIAPIIERRRQLEENIDGVWQILRDGAIKAKRVANSTLAAVRGAMGVSRDIRSIRGRFPSLPTGDAQESRDLELWSSVDYIVSSPSAKDQESFIDQLRIHWWRTMVPRDIGLKRPATNYENFERSLEEPYMTQAGKRVLVSVCEGTPKSELTIHGQALTWAFRIPQRSYEVWTLLLYRGVSASIRDRGGEILAIIIPQKVFSQGFALARRSIGKGDRLPISIAKTQNSRFYLELGPEQTCEVTQWRGNYDPLR